MAVDYSSIYSIKDFYNKVLPLYFDDKQLSLATVGTLGMFIDVNSSTTEDMMNITSRYISEIMPGQSVLPDFIYAQAANYGVTNILAKPAKMDMLLLIKEDNVITNGTNMGDHLEFTLDADLGILLDELSFSIPYDIKIRSILFNNEYNHMAYYNKNYNNSVVDENMPFIKTMKTDINGDIWLVLRVNVYQYKRNKIQIPITTNSILNIPYADVRFSNQLCNFEVFYTPPGKYDLYQLEKRAVRQPARTSPFVFYKFMDDNTLRLSFANDDRYWIPAYNSTITIYMYECNGSAGNVPLNKNGVDIYVNGSTGNESISYNKRIFPMGLSQGNSTGGNDQLNLDKIKLLTSEKMITVDSYTTDNDLNNYFNNFASIFDHSAKFVKQRDDYAGRKYGCFIKLNDGIDIIPTNTANIRLGTDEVDNHISALRQFIIKPGTTFIYNSLTDYDTLIKKKEDDPNTYDIEYMNAPLTIITTKPNKINYYINTIDKNIEVDYNYFNLNSIFNFVVKSCHIRRNAIKGEDSYHIDLQLARVDGAFNDLQSENFILQSSNGEIDVSKLEVLLIFDTNVGNYIKLTCSTTTTEQGEYVYDFSADIETNDNINNSRILLTNLLKRIDNTTDERLINMTNPEMKFCVFYNYGDVNVSHDYKDISVVRRHTLCNIYTPKDNEIYFAYPLDLMRSHVTFEDNPDSELGYNFYIKQVPLFGKEFLYNSENIDGIINKMINEHTFLNKTVESLHGLFTINMLFYNTYGRAKNFYIGYGKANSIINHVNCTFSMGIKFYDGILVEDYIDLIKRYIKEYFEKLNGTITGTNQAFVSVLDHELHQKFKDQIKYAIFYSINGYDSKYQIIENNSSPEDSSDIYYVPEYLTLKMSDIDITAL